jgi:hypothetical protein
MSHAHEALCRACLPSCCILPRAWACRCKEDLECTNVRGCIHQQMQIPTLARTQVREHASTGPYVDGLTLVALSDPAQMHQVLAEACRLHAVYRMQRPATASRAHTIFSIVLTQTSGNGTSASDEEKVSKIDFVDLAGSEVLAGISDAKLQDVGSTNKSMAALSSLVRGLSGAAGSDAGGTDSAGRSTQASARDSVVTELLKECLGGAAVAVLVATLSPDDAAYAHTLSTLRSAHNPDRNSLARFCSHVRTGTAAAMKPLLRPPISSCFGM